MSTEHTSVRHCIRIVRAIDRANRRCGLRHTAQAIGIFQEGVAGFFTLHMLHNRRRKFTPFHSYRRTFLAGLTLIIVTR